MLSPGVEGGHFFAFWGDNKELREIWVAFYFGEIELMKSEIRIGN